MKPISEVDSQSNSTALDADVTENTKLSLSKRSLLKAAWVPPVIVALSLPRSGYAANMSGTGKTTKAKENQGNHYGQFK